MTVRSSSVPDLEMAKVHTSANAQSGPRMEDSPRGTKGPDSDRSSRQASSKHLNTKPAPVPVLSQLRALVDTPESHEYLFPTPRGQSYGPNGTPRARDETEKGKQNFLFDFAAALFHRTEKALDDVSTVFYIETTFIVFPGVIMATYGKLPKSQTVVRRVSVGWNLSRLALLDDLVSSIKAKETGLQEAIDRVKQIMEMPPIFPPWVRLLCITLESACIAPLFFKGGWKDLLIAGVMGLIVGLLEIASARFKTLSRLYEPVCAIIISFLARILAAYIPGLCRSAINLAAISWLLPGLSVTTAMIEMATRHIISGTTRIFFAFLIAIELGFGIVVGQKMAFWAPDRALGTCEHELDVRYNAVFFPVTVMCTNLLLRAHPWQFISMSLCAAVGYVVSWALSTKASLSSDVSSATAAFAVAVTGNLWARVTGHAAIVPILGGIIVLVPGSLGVRGVLGFLSGQSDSGVSFAAQMIIVALSIAVGVFVGQLVKIPKIFCNRALGNFNSAL